MADKTKIEWADATFNPWIGCTKVGPGCDHCYAEREFDHRHHRAKWGAGQERVRTSAHNWRQPMRWNKQEFVQCPHCGWRGEWRDADERCGACPGCNCIPERFITARRRVFCASLADVFDNEVTAEWRSDLFCLIRATPDLDWLLLTKRISNAARMIDAAIDADECADHGWPWPNVWLGATITNQAEADRDIPKLLEVPAAVRFVSMEPLLGPVDLSHHLMCMCGYCGGEHLDWVVVGGESGPQARPMHPDWVRVLRDQCEANSVPFLFKQWGEWAEDKQHGFATGIDGGMRARRFDDGTLVERIGKRYAGRSLDGVEHNGYPV